MGNRNWWTGSELALDQESGNMTGSEPGIGDQEWLWFWLWTRAGSELALDWTRVGSELAKDWTRSG